MTIDPPPYLRDPDPAQMPTESGIEWTTAEQTALNRWRFAAYADAERALSELKAHVEARVRQAKAEAGREADEECPAPDLRAEVERLTAALAAMEARAVAAEAESDRLRRQRDAAERQALSMVDTLAERDATIARVRDAVAKVDRTKSATIMLTAIDAALAGESDG